MALIKAEVRSAQDGRIAAAKLEYERHPDRLAMEARIAEAHRRNLPVGREFAEFVNPHPAIAAKAEIARRHHVEVWRI